LEWPEQPKGALPIPAAATIGLRFLSASATRTGIPQSFAAAGILDTGPVWFAGHPLPNLPAPFLKLVADDPKLVWDLLQPLFDDPDRPLYGFGAAVGKTSSKSLSNSSAKLAQMSSALFSFAFTLATAFAISRLARFLVALLQPGEFLYQLLRVLFERRLVLLPQAVLLALPFLDLRDVKLQARLGSLKTT
jgi:hypothetical protein